MTFVVSLLTSLISILVYFNSGKISSKQNQFAVRAIALLIALIATLAALFKNLIIIPAGNVGVVELFGRFPLAPSIPVSIWLIPSLRSKISQLGLEILRKK
jgi:regulator of protease activity HflC (stomatin/prohibitin superfamily)